MRILIVEDDEFTAKALATVLADQHYVAEVATNGESAWELLEVFDYDLVLLDVMLPRIDGITLCRQMRSKGLHMPVLLLTGRDSSSERVVGLDAGADDYVVKPFDLEELIARIRALLRRGNTTANPVLEWGNLRLDPSTCEVAYGDRQLQLTPKEYALLELFLRNSRRVFSCGVILENLWSFEETPGEEAVRTHVKGLRQKLKSAGAPSDLVETVYGIGYRLKSIEITAAPTVAQEDEAEDLEPVKGGEKIQQQTLAAIARVWEQFKVKVYEQVSVLEQANQALHTASITSDLKQLAEQEAHTLAGSLGTFGFTKGSELARKIEHILQSDRPIGQARIERLDELVVSLRQEIQADPRRQSNADSYKPSDLEADKSPQQNGATASPDNGWSDATRDDYDSGSEQPLLLIVDPDRDLAEAVMAEAKARNFRVKIVTQLSEAREQVYSDSPNVVLLDPAISAVPEESLALITDLNKRIPAVPVLVLMAQDNLDDRVEVARFGGSAFLRKPILPSQIFDSITQVMQRQDSTTAKVMIVDDDPKILATLRVLLQPWGLSVITLDDPRQFWSTLEATSPDLLILDIKMPYLSGIDLCQVVRSDLRWGGLPVIFLTAYADAATVTQVFAAGADDFVSKPIVGPELITRIINRLERIKLLRNLAETDPLTRVSNRHKSTQDLDKFLQLAQENQLPFCLGVLDLDNLKQINDTYGHAIGDTVLKYIGHLLRQSFRGEDVVSRWGGEEFVVGMYTMTQTDGVRRLDKVLQTLRQQEFTAAPVNSKSEQPPVAFHVTCSAGVAEYPKDGDKLQALYQIADETLQQAKQEGCDRVLPALDGLQPELSMIPQQVGGHQ